MFIATAHHKILNAVGVTYYLGEYMPPLTGFALSCIDRIYKHSTPPAFGNVESLRAKQRQSEQQLEHLFHSLMQRAFRGELVGGIKNVMKY
jgi:hypothetical protein